MNLRVRVFVSVEEFVLGKCILLEFYRRVRLLLVIWKVKKNIVININC